ncbi:ABC transporter permease [Bacteroidia bacterium]|nr:ABC transporter permease [Bacteroidia bacterium]
MFDIDNWLEIFDSIKKNKLRTFLTGFSISWGIFIFIILLATSNGVRTGLSIVFKNRSSNIIEIQGRLTSVPFKGLPDNRKISLEQKDYDLLNRTDEKEYLSALIPIKATISVQSNYTTGDCIGIYPDYSHVNGIKIIDNQGRLINDMDMKEKRKVTIINKRLREILFKNENPIGKTILINELKFTVTGVYEEQSITDIEKAYIPFTTSQLLFNGSWGFTSLAFTIKGLDTNEKNEKFNDRIINNLAEMHQFDPADKVAVNLTNQLRTYLQTVSIFNAIVIFIWIIGLSTLFAGMIGVCNIMLITVKERTKEFGIRKALGATPASILKGIILEAVCITTLFGYIGLFLGIGVNAAFNSFLKNNPDIVELAVFQNPTVDLNIALGAMVLLVITGAMAGYFPARQAVKTMPIEAMREE